MNVGREILKKGAKALLSVEEHGNDSLTASRLEVCFSCDKYREDSGTCGVCGCYMDVKATLLTFRNPKELGRIDLTYCPLGKWGDSFIPTLNDILHGKAVTVEPSLLNPNFLNTKI